MCPIVLFLRAARVSCLLLYFPSSFNRKQESVFSKRKTSSERHFRICFNTALDLRNRTTSRYLIYSPAFFSFWISQMDKKRTWNYVTTITPRVSVEGDTRQDVEFSRRRLTVSIEHLRMIKNFCLFGTRKVPTLWLFTTKEISEGLFIIYTKSFSFRLKTKQQIKRRQGEWWQTPWASIVDTRNQVLIRRNKKRFALLIVSRRPSKI